MQFIDISKKKYYNIKVSGFSSELDSIHSVANLIKDSGSWVSQKRENQQNEYLLFDLGDILPCNCLEIIPSINKKALPAEFRLESSVDLQKWEIFYQDRTTEDQSISDLKIQFPLRKTRYIKLLILKNADIDNRFYSEIGKINIGIAGIKTLAATSSSGNENQIEKTLTDNANSYWESAPATGSSNQEINIDLGESYNLNFISMKSPAKTPNAFPSRFIIETSIDQKLWTTVVSERNFKSIPETAYSWSVPGLPARYIKMDVHTVKIQDKHLCQIAEIGISAAVNESEHTHSTCEQTPVGSVFQSGIVKFARDGESTPSTAVQGNDSRLRNASTLFKGVIQLAEDGDSSAGLAVQASDSRLQPATTLQAGIVRYGYNGEEIAGAAVQCNDTRLQEATENSFGIVRICPDGLDSILGVVRGNDSRLKQATHNSAGICRLAADGEVSLDGVVTGNDKRLKDAATTHRGIVELAEDGEDKEGVVVQGNDRRLRKATTNSNGIIELAEDGEDKEGVVVQGNDRRLKDATTTTKGIVELAENGEDKNGVVVQGNDKRLKDATTATKGIVELADDGEDKDGVVVQGNDKRLKDATTTTKGIIRFATDGGTEELTAIQGSDKRLKLATTITTGIVELAEDGEDKDGVVVQGNDKRLKDATTTTKGIVELAENGEDKNGVAVQGNDKRLKDATETTPGILRFAANGESSSFAAVQGNDKRLKDATTTGKGIVELAEDGEASEGVAVQGHDKRLKGATTITKGIVELAEDGETNEGVVVQGHDKRLQPATEERHGIIRLARDGEISAEKCIKGNDCRLSDAREPLPHQHPYAAEQHDFNTHTGDITIKGEKNHQFMGITIPTSDSALIYSRNSSTEAGAIGLIGIAESEDQNSTCTNYGILGHGSFNGVRGQSKGYSDNKPAGAGVMGISRFGAGGLFVSEHNYALVADGFGKVDNYDDTLHLIGKGDALLVNGRSEFHGEIKISKADKGNEHPANISELFEVIESEFIAIGDLLVASPDGGVRLARSRTPYSTTVIGIVAGNPAILLDNQTSTNKLYPVALAGSVLCKVDARTTPIKTGDLIVTSETPGCGMAGKIDSFNKIGSVIGKALTNLEEGISLIPVLIARS